MMEKVKNNKRKYLFTIFLVVFFVLLFMIILNKKAYPVVMNYASVETRKIAIEVLRETGVNEVNKKIKDSKLLDIDKNNSGNIEGINVNTPIVNDILVIVSKSVRKRLKEVEKGINLPYELYPNFLDKKFKNGMVYGVPIGIVFNNIFFSSFGPRIPVKVGYSGNVGLDVKTHVKSYGLNSALVEVYIFVEVTQRTILPFQLKEEKVTSEIPVVMRVIKGNLPNYVTGTSSYSLPIN